MKPIRVQYTIRNIPAHLDRVLRRRAQESGKSFNQTVLDTLAGGLEEPRGPRRDLGGIAGSLSEKDARRLDEEVRRQRQIDVDLWK